MRDYGKVYSTFWSSETTSGLSSDGKLLALYLMTCSHSTIAGVFRLPDGYVAEDLNWVPERVAKGFAELLDKGFANRCGNTKWVWVCKHLEWNKPENPNQRKSAAKIAASIPDLCAWKLDFMRVFGELLDLPVVVESNPCETLAKPFLNQEQKQEQKTEKKQPSVDGFMLFWQTYPKKVGKPAAQRAFKTAKLNGHLPDVLADIESKKSSDAWTKDGGQFIPNPATYLNQRRWEDETQADQPNIFAGAI